MESLFAITSVSILKPYLKKSAFGGLNLFFKNYTKTLG